MADYTSSFQGSMNSFLTFFKSAFSLQASSDGGGSGICLFPSMTSKDIIGIQISIYGIIIIDFLIVACVWLHIRAPVLSLQNRRVTPLIAWWRGIMIRFFTRLSKAMHALGSLVAKYAVDLLSRLRRPRQHTAAPDTAIGIIELRDSSSTATEALADLQVKDDQVALGSEAKEEQIASGSEHLLSDSAHARSAPVVSFPDNVRARADHVTETRGAAALQLFLFIYISPIELSLKMLNCVTLDGL
jgi:hypothetical protein